MMATMEPDEWLAQLRKDRADYDRARGRLFRHITQALAAGAELPEHERRKLGPSAIGRAVNFTREYISKIRDGDQA